MKSPKARAGARRAATSPGAAPPPGAGRWSQQRRLELIDFRLRWDGRLNRSDLTSYFGISVPQASLDIATYLELAPNNLEYDHGARVYVARPDFRALYPSSGAAPFLNELLSSRLASVEGEHCLLGFRPPIAVTPTPGRSLNIDVLVALQRAIRMQAGLTVLYQSLTRPAPSERALSPHAFVHDGYRWHVRAYCHVRHAFRDFVIARVQEVGGTVPVGLGPAQDVSWNTMLKLVLAPHPELPVAHRRAVELDYGMVNGLVELECREALLFYVLQHLRLDRGSHDPPEAQQIILVNADALERHRKVAGGRRVA